MDAGGLSGVEQKGAEDRIRGFVRAGIAKILRHQNDDGGFGLWIGRRLGAALHGLRPVGAGDRPSRPGYPSRGAGHRGRRALPEDAAAGEAAGRWGRAARWRARPERAPSYTTCWPSWGRGIRGRWRALFERRRELPVYGRAFLLRALVKTERNDQARALAGELLALIPGSTGPAIVKEGAGLDWYWSSDVRTTALVLLALLEAIARRPRGHRPVGPGAAGRAQPGALVQHPGERVRPDRPGGAGPGAGRRRAGQGDGRRGGAGSGPHGDADRDSDRAHSPAAAAAGQRPAGHQAAGGEIFYAARLHVERPVSPDALDAGLAIRREYLDPDSGAPARPAEAGSGGEGAADVVSPGGWPTWRWWTTCRQGWSRC